jgi:hypothetical protein
MADEPDTETCRRCDENPADAGYGYCKECVAECGAEAMDRLDY